MGDDRLTREGEVRAVLFRGGGRWPALTAAAAGTVLFAAVATGISWHVSAHRWWIDWPLRLWGLGVLVPGVIVWVRAANPWLGQLMVAAAATYYLHFLRGSTQPVIFAVGFCLAYLWTGIVAHLVLTWPSGRITRRGQWAMVAVCYLAPVGSQVARYLIDHPRPAWAFGIPEKNTAAARGGSILFAALAFVVVGILVRRWATSSQLRRRPGEPVWVAIAVAFTIAAAVGVASVLSDSGRFEIPLLVAALSAGLFLVPSVYWVQRQRARSARWGLATIALDTDSAEVPPDPARLQQALGDAVGDPTLWLIYRLDNGSYVDIRGHTVAQPQPSTGRGVTNVYRHGRLFALIEHDEALSDERSLAEAASAAAGVAIENAHLYATMRAQIEQIRSSRLRLATAAFEERRRIQRDLHDGAQQQLFAVLVLLDLARHELGPADSGPADQARATVCRAHDQLQQAIQTLRELTEHIYPVTLVEHGLAHAVESMADRSPIPVSVHIDLDRWPLQVESAAYFVICEALANVYKHAQASQASVTVTPDNGQLLVQVRDNGRGGARVQPGRGLAGLQDRVAVVGGTLSIDRRPGGGTQLASRLPLENP
jgi:signal transduction histidine kinase